MAVAKGKVSNESSGFKTYVGVGNVKVLGVNLSKEELSKVYGTEVTNDRVFVGEVEQDGKKVPVTYLNFTVQKEADKTNDLSFVVNVRYNLTRAARWNRDHTKKQVIDKYGRTAWATNEEIAAHAIPQYTNGPANIDSSYRPAYRGEEQLILFIKALLGIPNVTKFVDGKPVGLIDTPEDAECSLEHIEDYFKGNFSELKEILSYQPNNKVKILFGARKDDQGRMWQDSFINWPMTAGTTKYEKLEYQLKASKDAGAFPNTTFEVCDVKEYVEVPSEVDVTDTPAPASNSPWFE